MVLMHVGEELIANRFLAFFRLGAPRANEDRRTFRTETAKMTLFFNAPQGRLRHDVSHSHQFEIHIECWKRAPLRGALSVLPPISFSTLSNCFVGKFGAKLAKRSPEV